MILGSIYLETLLEYIDVDMIPKFFGGNLECKLELNSGPWNPDNKLFFGLKNQ